MKYKIKVKCSLWSNAYKGELISSLHMGDSEASATDQCASVALLLKDIL